MRFRNVLAFAVLASLSGASAFAQCAPVAGDPMPGAFFTGWDWSANRRQLTYCIDAATPFVISSGADFAASNLSNAGLGWTLVKAGVCPAGWNLRNPIANQPDIRIRAARLGPIPVVPAGGRPDGGSDFPERPNDYDYPSDMPVPEEPYPGSPGSPGQGPWGPGMPGPGGGGGGGRPRFARPPLAYFQPGPFTMPGGRWIRSGEVVYNWDPPPPADPNALPTDPKWSSFIDPLPGTLTYDPRIVGMHELGHAIRLDHDDTNFDTDVSVYPTGSRTPQVTTKIILRGPNQALKSRVLPDDVVNGDLEAGANKIADSGKKMAVMRSAGIPGMHGINPGLGLPPGSAYSYTEKERSTARAACRDKPPAKPMRLLAGFGRWQQWAAATLVDGAGNPVQTYNPGLVGNGITGDFVADPIPAASGLTGTVDTRIDGLPGSSHVNVHIFAAANASGTAQVIVPLPYSKTYTDLRVEADVSGGWLSYQNGSGGTLCAGPLATLDPADCGLDLLNAGAVAIELTFVPTVSKP
ncbi:MAG: hypothetical protein ACJ75H_06140 [Thermoanaerobaculia bacterium]